MLLLIILTLLVLLFLLSSPLLLYHLNGMALSWLCFDSWTSQLRRAHRQRQTLWDFLFYQEECSRRGAENQMPSFLSVNPATPAPHPPKRWNAVQNEEEGGGGVLYLQLRWLFSLYNMVLKYLRLSRNKNPKLDIYLLTHRGTFLILKSNFMKKKKNLIFKWMSSAPTGKTYLHCSKSKTTLWKRPKALSFLPDMW